MRRPEWRYDRPSVPPARKPGRRDDGMVAALFARRKLFSAAHALCSSIYPRGDVPVALLRCWTDAAATAAVGSCKKGRNPLPGPASRPVATERGRRRKRLATRWCVRGGGARTLTEKKKPRARSRKQDATGCARAARAARSSTKQQQHYHHNQQHTPPLLPPIPKRSLPHPLSISQTPRPPSFALPHPLPLLEARSPPFPPPLVPSGFSFCLLAPLPHTSRALVPPSPAGPNNSTAKARELRLKPSASYSLPYPLCVLPCAVHRALSLISRWRVCSSHRRRPPLASPSSSLHLLCWRSRNDAMQSRQGCGRSVPVYCACGQKGSSARPKDSAISLPANRNGPPWAPATLARAVRGPGLLRAPAEADKQQVARCSCSCPEVWQGGKARQQTGGEDRGQGVSPVEGWAALRVRVRLCPHDCARQPAPLQPVLCCCRCCCCYHCCLLLLLCSCWCRRRRRRPPTTPGLLQPAKF